MGKPSKIKYLASLVIFFLIAFSFIFGNIFKIVKRDIPDVSAEGINYSLSADGSTLTIGGSGQIVKDEVSNNIGSATKVVIEEGIESIADNAFIDKTNITDVTIPSSVTYVGESAFENCERLSNITFLNNIDTIHSRTFYGCKALKKLVVPEGVISVQGSAFYGCTSLEEITLKENVKSILDYAFCDCTSLKKINFPGNIEVIESYAFKNCSSLTEADLSLTKIGSLQEGVFCGCNSLENIKIPETVSNVATLAFSDCTSLQDISLLSLNASGIQEDAFSNCTSLRSLTLRNNAFISSKAIFNCPNLKRICWVDNIPWCSGEAFNGVNANGDIYLGENRVTDGNTSNLLGAGIPEAWFRAKTVPTKEMFSLNSAEVTYDGNGKTLDLNVPEGLTSYSLEYSSDDGATWSTDPPKDCGVYKTKVIVKYDENYSDAEFILDDTFIINKANLTQDMFGKNMSSVTYNGHERTDLTVYVPTGLTSYTIQYSSDNGTTWSNNLPKDVGVYKIKVISEGNANYNDSEVILNNDFEIRKADLMCDMFSFKYTNEGNRKTLNVLAPVGLSSYSLEYSLDDGATWSANFPENTQTYKIKVKSENDANYNDSEIVFSYNNGYITDSNGYITDENGLVKYKDKENNTYDFKGYVDGTWRQVTYSDGGFRAKTWPSSDDSNEIKVTSNIEFVSSGGGLLLKYHLENTTNENIDNFRFWVGGDTMVNGDDSNTNIIAEDGTAILTGNGVSFFSFSSSQGGTAVPAYYSSGGQGQVGYSDIRDGADPSTVSACTQKQDSALVCYFPLSSLEPGQSLDYTLVFGTGDEQTAKKIAQEIKEDIGIVTVTVKDSNDNTLENINVQKGSKIEDLIMPTKPYHELSFGGWYDDIGLTNEKDNTFVINESLTLYVKWIKANPTADHFTFSAPNDLVYSKSNKSSSIIANSGVEGMGNITIKYYSNPGCTNVVEPKDVGTYYVGINVDDTGSNYNATTGILTKADWNFAIIKANPTADDFTFAAPSNLAYDGNTKSATVTKNDDLDGMGNASIKYYSDPGCTNEIEPKDIGTYYVGITVDDTGSNYNATNTPLTKDGWKFEITKAEPKADCFTFAAPSDLVYSGNAKSATVTKNSDIVGMGNVTINYYSDPECTNVVEPKNVGTYYVGITVDDTGSDYSATATPLTKDSWNFEITKADPKADDFTFVAPNDLVYSGNTKSATVSKNSNIVGMGDISVKYYNDFACKNEVEPKNVGIYYVGITVDDTGSNYNAKDTPLTKDGWNFEIAKANPTADDFTFAAPKDLVYNGKTKSATVTKNSDIVSMGDISVKYYSDFACKKEVEPKNVGTYYVGITVDDAGNNYNATNTPLTKDGWNFEITKADPKADDFTFAAPKDLVYNGKTKSATVTKNSDIVGMGETTINYYSDPKCTNLVEPKDVGTYYVGITVDDSGSNYNAITTPLTKGGWNFEITKAEPILDFQIINGGTTGTEPILLSELKEVLYGTTLKNAEDILPSSSLGTWNFKNPDEILDKVGENYIELVFTPNDAKNYDWSKIPGWNEDTKILDVKKLISIKVDKTNWGTEITSDGAKYYVSSDGTTSTEITGTDGIYWVKEESYDSDLKRVTSAWYGVDNSSGIFEPGSRLSIKWINKEENPEEWNTYNPMIDEAETQNIPDAKKWIFLAEVIHPDGVTKYTKLPNSVPFYVQLGDDWDIEDVNARFISSNEDEPVRTTYIRSLAYPAGRDEFMRLDLMHFSPYVIYDKDNPNNSNDIKTKEQPDNDVNEEAKDNEREKGNNNYFIWILGGSGTGILALALLWWLLYRKKRKNKKLIVDSILAQIGNSNSKRI